MNLRLRLPPLSVLAIAGLLALVCDRAFPTLGSDSMARLILSTVFVVLGFICSYLGVASFRQARTTVNPLNPGAASALVVTGIYRFTRNPMYLGFLFFLLGELVWLASPIALLVAPAFVSYLNRFQIEPEEQALVERFGAEYSTYVAHVPRWI
jgi:protein-S-isoprenylcysteine O-methyltransferase Ste14